MLDTVQEVIGQQVPPLELNEPLKAFNLFEMLIRYGEFFFKLAGLLNHPDADRLFGEDPSSEEARETAEMIGTFAAVFRALDCKASAIYADRIVLTCQENPREVGSRGMVSILRERIKDDLTGLSFIYVADPSLYNSKEPFGDLVTAKFPNTITDLQEAGKCLALKLSTASVFHLMRALDASMRHFIAALGTTAPQDRDWQYYLDAINKAVGQLPTTSELERSRKSDMAAAASNLYNVKLAWRNGVMHPKDSYSPEEAREVYDSVKIFMRHLAGVL